MLFIWIRKLTYCIWENIFNVLLMNFIMVLLFSVTLILSLVSHSIFITIFLFTFFFIFKGIHDIGLALMFKKAVLHEAICINDYLNAIKSGGILRGCLSGILQTIIIAGLLTGIPFYFKIAGLLGWVAMGMVIWVFVIYILIMQWFPSVCAFFPGPISEQLGKCLLFTMQNLGLSLFSLVFGFLLDILSIFTIFIIPGLSGNIILANSALELVIQKYKWIEKQQTGQSTKFCWKEILDEEEKLMGNKTLKNVIFPWQY